MKTVDSISRNPKLRSVQTNMGVGSWSVIVLLLLFLGAALYFAYVAWMADADILMSDSAYVAITFGVIASILVGVGLMTLIFFSNRSGYDESPRLEQEDEERER